MRGDKQPRGYKVRKGGWTVGEKETRWLVGSERCLYGHHLWDGEPTDVYLCEGESDVMALVEHGRGLALGLGGNPSHELWGEWVNQIVQIVGNEHRVYSCFDNDKVGAKYHNKLLTYLPRELDVKTLWFPPNSNYKDVADLLMGGEELKFIDYISPPELLEGAALLEEVTEHIGETISTGYRQLDILIGGGWYPGKFVCLGGLPKNGKSTFAAQLALNFAHYAKVLLIPLELTSSETMAVLGGIHKGKHPTTMSNSEIYDAKKELVDYGRLALIRHHGFVTIGEMTRWLHLAREIRADMVVLDHVTSATTSYDEGLTTQLLDGMLSLIKAKLNELKLCGLVVTHVNASAEEGKPITLRSMRGSLSLAQLPDVVLGIRRCENGTTELHTVTVDRRAGINGRIVFDFNGKYSECYMKANTM
jgi:hypothetical protein